MTAEVPGKTKRFAMEAVLDIDLDRLLVLVIDCQTSGSNVEKSHILEIGWLPARAGDAHATDSFAPVVHLVRPPKDWRLPPRVEKLTGIDDRQLSNGLDAGQVWRELAECADWVAAQNRLPFCPAVIHYARFEMGFLHKLAAQADAQHRTPIEAICTHQMAVRLLPGLPRKGLRAVAGFFGHSIGKRKRCRDHLLATRAIWRRLAKRLADEHAIVTLNPLLQWLRTPLSTAAVQRTYPMPRGARRKIPQAPGVYRMHRSNGDLLYIGKATNLRQRINSYFRSGSRHSETILEMLSQAMDLQTTVTASALEAALLESDEIKRCRPPYNTALTGDRRALYFLSRDFRQYGTAPDKVRRTGPVPALDPFTAAAALDRYLSSRRNGIDADEIPQLLALAQRHGPEPECIALGLERFRRTYSDVLCRSKRLHGLLHIGRNSWMEKRHKRETEAGTDSDPDTDASAAADPEPFVWTPEIVEKTIVGLLRHCGFLLRRARWLAMLSESTIAWRRRDPDSDLRNVILLHRGDIIERSVAGPDDPLAAPPGAAMPTIQRRRNLDLTTYDRLRVLTTELRRLLAEQRPLAIRLNRGICLGQQQLRRLLQWI